MRFDISDTSIEAPVFNEVLTPVADDIGVLASYISDYYAGQPAVTLRRMGKGRVVQFGSFFTPQNVKALLDSLAIQDPFRAWAEIPAEVQATVRTSESERFCFLLNFTNESKAVTFNKPTFDLLEERELRGQAEVPPYGVRFVRL